MGFIKYLFYFFLLLTCHTTIPAIIIKAGTVNIIVLIIVSCSSVAVYVTVPVLFLAVISSSLSTRYYIESITSSLLYPS